MATITKTANVEFKGKETYGIWAQPIMQAPESPFMGWTKLTNVKYRSQKLLYNNHLRNIIKKGGSCGFNADGSFDIYGRTITTKELKAELSLCAKDFNCTEIEELLATGTAKADIIGSTLSAVILKQMADGAKYDLYLNAWFGEEGSALVNFNKFNGIWTELKELADGDYIPYNDSGSGSALAPTDALDVLQKVYNDQSNALFQCSDTEKVFYVTRSVYQALMADYTILNSLNCDLALINTIEGKRMLTFYGIEVKPEAIWNDYFNAAGLTNQHYVLLTVPANLAIATNQEKDLNKIESWYERKEQMNYFRAEYEFGANFVHPELFSVAY